MRIGLCALFLTGASAFVGPISSRTTQIARAQNFALRLTKESDDTPPPTAAASDGDANANAAAADETQQQQQGDDDDQAASAAEAEHEEWLANLKSKEIQEVREELIFKYVKLGKGQEEAEREVDKFLSDPEQSEQYLEMRRYAKAQADELGPELILQLGGAFALGLGATVIPKYISAYKVSRNSIRTQLTGRKK